MLLTDIELSKVQLSNIIQSGGFLCALLDKFAVALLKVSIPLTKNVFVPLPSMTSASAVDSAIQNKKVNGRTGKIIASVILNKDMDDTIRF